MDHPRRHQQPRRKIDQGDRRDLNLEVLRRYYLHRGRRKSRGGTDRKEDITAEEWTYNESPNSDLHMCMIGGGGKP